MKIGQSIWTSSAGWTAPTDGVGDAQLVLAFGSVGAWQTPGLVEELKRRHPAAHLVGCSTAGEIYDTRVLDDSLVATAMRFERTTVRTAKVELEHMAESSSAGERLACLLPASVAAMNGEGADVPLTHLFVFSDGVHVNGSELVHALARYLPTGVTVTGGPAGDGAKFSETLVVCDAAPASRVIAAVALYGRGLRVGFGSLGGWDPFGPERVITKARGNVLYELDGHSALGLYEKYLGDHAKELPAAGLLFPLSLRSKAGDTPVVRTILAIDREAQTLTFAGDVPEGAYARLMKANFDRLIARRRRRRANGLSGDRFEEPGAGAVDQLRGAQARAPAADRGGGRGRAGGARGGNGAGGFLFLWGDFAFHSGSEMRTA